ncbi:AEC family transporter [Clostridium cellulovorans]|uniref:Auxin Efflux Carrier n=2 Tax=Clostridium cellulovorans TaxID=1493 RepID=D9SS63_CLOC7|nr:AEC family transporter [Clostridium cellulovorans]ADL52510.1 Auxin Efflux Carrier [Clostridium cellulovorans 743B]
MVIIQSIQSIMTILLMISVGYILDRKKWFNEESKKLLSKLVVNISLPAYMLQNIVTNFTREKLFEMSGGLLIPFVSIGICYIVAVVIAKAIKVPKKRFGTFVTLFFVSNTIFIGLPVNLALFGEQSIPYVFLYYIANTTFFWTLGVYSISKDGDAEDTKLFSIASLKKCFSPPMLGFIIGIIFVIINLKIPFFILDTCKYLGNLTTPLSMLFIGATMAAVDLKTIRIDKEMIFLNIGRSVISPLIVIILGLFIKGPMLMKEVFIIQAAMPGMINISIISKAYNADYEYAAVMITVTTIVSMISIPIFMAIMDKLPVVI